MPGSRPLLTLVSLIFVGFNGGVPVGDRSGLSFIGTGSSDAARLARSVGAPDPITCPGAPAAESWTWDWSGALEAWTGEVGAVPEADRIVVCTWADPVPDTALVDLDPVEWRRQVEWPTALWFTTLVAAAGRCRDGGSVVAVVDRPATLDAIGQSAAVTVAEGVVNVVRSLAAREGGRGVRVERGPHLSAHRPRGSARLTAAAGHVPGPHRRRGRRCRATPARGRRGRDHRHRARGHGGSAMTSDASPRTILVTGASGGVGRGIALACGAVGWSVWIAARRAEEGAAVAAEVEAAGGYGHSIVADVGDEDSVHTTIAAIQATDGRLDGVVHNATSGKSSQSTLHDRRDGR